MMTVKELRAIYPRASFYFFRNGVEAKFVTYHDEVESYEHKKRYSTIIDGECYATESVDITLQCRTRKKKLQRGLQS